MSGRGGGGRGGGGGCGGVRGPGPPPRLAFEEKVAEDLKQCMRRLDRLRQRHMRREELLGEWSPRRLARSSVLCPGLPLTLHPSRFPLVQSKRGESTRRGRRSLRNSWRRRSQARRPSSKPTPASALAMHAGGHTHANVCKIKL